MPAELVGHPLPEEAVDAADDAVTRPHQVGDHRLHSAAAGRAQGDRDAVVRAEDGPQPRGDLVHEVAEGRVEVPDGGMREGLQHPWRDGGWARTQQQALG